MLQLEGLTKDFGGTRAVDNVSLTIGVGAFVGVIGRSGAGKSTLLRMINRLCDPTSGRIIYDGREITRLKGQALRDWRQQAAMVFQQFALVGRLDVLTNVMMGRLNYMGTARSLLKLWREEDRAIALSALEQLDVANLSARRADTLSGGQQQRVAIARALAMRPKLLLLDEITSALDPELVNEVLVMMRELAEEGMTMLVATHEMGFARDVASKVCYLHQGSILEEGRPEQLFTAPEHARTAEFLRRTLEAGNL
jgi:phosphonate transport system ATP-binding protein